MSTILDASFAVDWSLASSAATLEDLIIEAGPNGFEAPVIFWHEVASAFRNLRRRKQIDVDGQRQMLNRLGVLNPRLDSASDIRAVIAASDRFSLTIYDAAYLELAQRLGADLATTDAALVAAARAAGLKVLTQ